MGGDCLNTGCVPSKALIAAARRAHDLRTGAPLGIAAVEPTVDFAAVHAHVHRAIATIAPIDSVEHMTELGCEVIRGKGVLTGHSHVTIGDRNLSAPRIILAVGSRPLVPPIEGIEATPYLTNETIFDLTELPEHLVVVGNGPIGIELAQAFRRLGSRVTVIAPGPAMPKDDADAAAVAVAALKADGVAFVDGEVARVEPGVTVHLKNGIGVSGSHLLLATGRSFEFAELGLAAAGVDHDEHGIGVDARRRTSNPRIYAIGDCRPGPHFTHVSAYEGSNMVLEIGLGLAAIADYRALPWVTYTDPEVAQVGLTEAEARIRHGDRITVWREDFADNDRAIAEGDTTGFVKLIKHGRKVVGATIVGAHAGDLILPAAMMVVGKASLFGVASLIVPYPNRAEHLKKAAFASQDSLVFNRWTRGWARLLARLRR